MHSERWIKRWKTQKTHALTNCPIRPSLLVWNLFCSGIQNQDFTWAVGHITSSGLGGSAGITTWPRPLLVSISTGDTARRPVTPVPLSVHIVWIRERERERSLALMQATCWTYSGLLACLTNNKGGEDMKGEVGELKVLSDFAPQSRYHGSLSTQMHTLCCICWCRAVEPKCPRWKAQYVCSVSEVTRKHFANSNKATVDPTVNFQIEIFPDTVAVDSIRLLCLWFIGLKMGSEMARNPL